jgi:predicted lipid-binding transport protein (Tim44 family)
VNIDMQAATETGSTLSAVLLFAGWWLLLTLLDLWSVRETKAASPAAVAPDQHTDAASQCAAGEVYPGFNEREFLSRAARAYEAILQAYAILDLDTLRRLLAQEVFNVFEAAIAERVRRAEKLHLVFICHKTVAIDRVSRDGSYVEISVHFAAHLFSAVLSSEGAVVDGDPKRLIETRDLWTFSRDISGKDNPWLLTATDDEVGASRAVEAPGE